MIIVFRGVHSDKNFRIFLQKACQKSMNFDLKISKTNNAYAKNTIETLKSICEKKINKFISFRK